MLNCEFLSFVFLLKQLYLNQVYNNNKVVIKKLTNHKLTKMIMGTVTLFGCVIIKKMLFGDLKHSLLNISIWSYNRAIKFV